MKLLIIRLTASHVYANRVNLGCWLDWTDNQLNQHLLHQVHHLVMGGTLKFIDEGFSDQDKIKWYLLTQVWLYEWSKNWHVKLRMIGNKEWLDINRQSTWCERTSYTGELQIPVAVKRILVAHQLLDEQKSFLWTNVEEYHLGCRVRVFILSSKIQLMIIELRDVGADQWLGYRLMLTAIDKLQLQVIVADNANLISNGQKKVLNQHIEYKAYDKLCLETQNFKLLFQQQKQKWTYFWRMFNLTWETDYRWRMVYQRLMYQAYLAQSITTIQEMLWAEPLLVTGDFSCLKWQCDWRPVLTGLLTWLIGGKIIDHCLIITAQPQLPLFGQRNFTINVPNHYVKIRLTNDGMAVQPSKVLKVICQGKVISCRRQCWTIVWQNY